MAAACAGWAQTRSTNAAPINAAVAANVLSDGSIAYASANQADQIQQGAANSNLPVAK